MPGNFHSVPQSVVDSWPTPNYVDPITRDWMPAFAITWQAASTVLIAGRFYLRARKQAGEFGLDDLLIFIGWLFSLGFTTTAWIGSAWYGLDRHTWDVRPPLYARAALNGWIAQLMFIFSTVPTKLSVLMFYRRMVKDTLNRRWLLAIYAALFITVAYGVAVFLTYCNLCHPLDAYWLSYNFSYDTKYTCIEGDALTLAAGGCSVLSDMYAVAVPCLILRHYHLDVPKRQIFALNMIFGLGLLVTGAGIGRTYYLWKINHTYDTSWTGFDLYIWSVVECQLAIICACAPSLRVFFRHYLRDTIKRTFTSRSSVSYHADDKHGRTAVSANTFTRQSNSYEAKHGGIEVYIDGKSRPESSVWEYDGHEYQTTCRSSQGCTRHESETSEVNKITTPEQYELYITNKQKNIRRRYSLKSMQTMEACGPANNEMTPEDDLRPMPQSIKRASTASVESLPRSELRSVDMPCRRPSERSVVEDPGPVARIHPSDRRKIRVYRGPEIQDESQWI